jgi:hypothetical protein
MDPTDQMNQLTLQQAAGGAGGAGGAGSNQIYHVTTEDVYVRDVLWNNLFDFNEFKNIVSTKRVFENHVGGCFLRETKCKEVVEFLSKLHMQYLFVWHNKAQYHTNERTGTKMSMMEYNKLMLNPDDAPPFNSMKRWIVLPVLSLSGNFFPASVLKTEETYQQAARVWLNNYFH